MTIAKVTVSIKRSPLDVRPRWKTHLYAFHADGGRSGYSLNVVHDNADEAVRYGETEARKRFADTEVAVSHTANVLVAFEDVGPPVLDAPPITVVILLRRVRQKGGAVHYASVTRTYNRRGGRLNEVEDPMAHEDPRAAVQTAITNARMQYLSEPIVTSPVAVRMVEDWEKAQVGAPA